jgi:hypothetical protein
MERGTEIAIAPLYKAQFKVKEGANLKCPTAMQYMHWTVSSEQLMEERRIRAGLLRNK